MTPYDRPLDASRKEIRLLHLEPGNFNSEIIGYLVTVSLHDVLLYDAISYFWGDVNGKLPITINSKEMLITRHLFCTLNHLRSSSKYLVLWADAICINQEDVEERNIQVLHMGHIFASAARVLIFLGPADPLSIGSDAAFDILLRLSERKSVSKEVLEDAYEHCVNWMVRRAWFSRLWVIQELALARNSPVVYCGRKAISWDMLVYAWGKLLDILDLRKTNHRSMFYQKVVEKRYSDQPPAGESKSWFDGEPRYFWLRYRLRSLDHIRDVAAETEGMDLVDILPVSRHSHCKDPRDKIYGILNLLKEEDRRVFSVDYRKSVKAVYTEVLIEVFKQGKGPWILSSMILQDPDENAHLPSWVIDLAIHKTRRLNDPLSLHPPGIGCSGKESTQVNGVILPDNETLRIRGLLVDTVNDVLVFPKAIKEVIERLVEVDELITQSNNKPSAASPNLKKYTRKEPLWRMLISNMDVDGAVAPEWFGTMYEILRGFRLPPKGSKDKSVRSSYFHVSRYSKTEDDYRRALYDKIRNRSFFTTEGGFMARGMPFVRKGDQVVIIFGAPVPFVLRSCGDYYKIVGVAYVGGIMEGELVDELYHKGLMKEQEFLIR
ncbi:hypothetical protein M501DRAFT_937224 [Patellaria atrata CBS 101060]|uniref:Heterokaryon incompatibility domain-containing protein n=1 Tax=Patellaria atrata CBS 101060 TaxID=1346257 RepID=A0A9P4S7L7_9PEZI|nr:hypothetical protein M501DRAFT_937224 [Patellaria atrata CBS 101060]